MEQSILTCFVIRVKILPKNQNDKELWRWQYVQTRYNTETLVDRIDEATSFDKHTVESLIRSYHTCIRKFGDGNVDYLKAVLSTNIEIIDMDEDLYLEERRRVALNKLSTDDIRALGVERLAVYNKLKHQPEKDNLTIDV